MLGILGIGLRGYRSLTVEEKEFIESSDRVFLDEYTSVIFPAIPTGIEGYTGKKVEAVARNILEDNDFLLDLSKELRVSLLVSGDPFMATTHNEIRYQCIRKGIEVKIFENASILNSAVGYAGLSPYRVAAPVSLPRVTEKFFPVSVYRKISRNKEENRHSILLLDTADGNPMTVKEALDTLVLMEERERSGLISPDTEVIVICALGTEKALLLHGSMGSVSKNGKLSTPATIIVPAELDENEKEYVNAFCDCV